MHHIKMMSYTINDVLVVFHRQLFITGSTVPACKVRAIPEVVVFNVNLSSETNDSAANLFMLFSHCNMQWC